MDYLATFHTHYGAMAFYRFCNGKGIAARMAPVPRELSASCGVCVCLSAESPPKPAEHEDMECCYQLAANSRYKAVEG